MTTATSPGRARDRVEGEPRWSLFGELSWALSDAMTITWRSMIHTIRVRELWIFVIVQPVVFVLLFAFVFGGAIPLPGGGSYREFLMAGVFTQTVAFTTYPTALGVAFDKQLGLMDRFRTLPMHPSAIFVGRTLGDLMRTAMSIAVMAVCGLAVGWRIHGGVLDAAAAFGLLLLFGYGMSWVGAFVGFASKSVAATQSTGFLWLFPVTFVSSAFVPPASLPAPMEFFADWNPVSAVAASARGLFGNPNPFADAGSFPSEHPVLLTVVWSLVLFGVFSTLCTRAFRKVAAA
jgi:ABC transporter DrrB family efflux protein